MKIFAFLASEWFVNKNKVLLDSLSKSILDLSSIRNAVQEKVQEFGIKILSSWLKIWYVYKIWEFGLEKYSIERVLYYEHWS